ncbi:MAG: hypothetical protein WBB66_07320 [Candidatus Omnitrophota bacterium]
MKKKRYIQCCEIGGSIYGKKKSRKRTASSRRNVSKKDLAHVYDKFFKDQVSALYRAISNS